MNINYDRRTKEYTLFSGCGGRRIPHVILTVSSDYVQGFVSMLSKQPEEYQLLACIGYGMAMAAFDNDNPMLDALVEKYGGRFDG